MLCRALYHRVWESCRQSPQRHNKGRVFVEKCVEVVLANWSPNDRSYTWYCKRKSWPIPEIISFVLKRVKREDGASVSSLCRKGPEAGVPRLKNKFMVTNLQRRCCWSAHLRRGICYASKFSAGISHLFQFSSDAEKFLLKMATFPLE